MVQYDDLPVRIAQVCPPGLNFYFRNEVELPIFVNGTFRNLVSVAKYEIPVEAFAGRGLPIAAMYTVFPSRGLLISWQYCFAILNQPSLLSRRRFL